MRTFRGGGAVLTRSDAGFGGLKTGNRCCDWVSEKFISLEFWKFGRIKRRLSQSFACARHHEPSNGFDGVVIQPIKSKSLRFIIKQIVSTMPDKLDCHGGQSFARLAMTEWRDFACANFITTLNFQASKLPNFYKSLTAFTMAEILISLTIIGVIAAITLPSLQANINEKTWATQKKALYSRMSQAIALMPSLNGWGVDPESATNTKTNAALTFLTDGLSKVLEISNICSYDKFSDCGIVSKFKNTAGSVKTFPTSLHALHQALDGYHAVLHPTNANIRDSFSLPNTNGAAFVTKNGESVAVYYQPNCRYSSLDASSSNIEMYVLAAPYMCVNFIYDLNGKKGPNQGGKDIGSMTVFYPTDSEVVMPIPLRKDNATGKTYADALKVCRNVSSDVRLPNKEELASLGINELIYNMQLGIENGRYYAAQKNWKVLYNASILWSTTGYDPAVRVRCIKR